jgi:hypothetical protein
VPEANQQVGQEATLSCLIQLLQNPDPLFCGAPGEMKESSNFLFGGIEQKCYKKKLLQASRIISHTFRGY